MKEQQPIQDEMETGVKEELENADTDNVTDDGTPEEDVQEQAAGDQDQALEAETEKLKAEIEEHKQRLLRTQADYDNFRRRTVKEKEELGKYASAKLITELLPVIDNFERALGSVSDVPEAASYAKGVEMIFRQLEGILKAEGLTPMEAVGTPFNPEYHQAIMQVESDEYEEGDVVEEVQKGYMLKDKVLRPAMVKVKG
ncbi:MULTISPECIES: nucleotide exchange factor GrpE [Paenibacillus]|uniref:Protein GrpE n=2 Tax=Paenibacillus TaxID=44249 RepID=A0A919Y1L8_9BACL|nr:MULTISPECIES: nucleotide exchange factor GrpE [Paenibacillus]GIO36001.1 nucleotide exchange factor GrpE [Paenibacillus antibioticophila]GIO40522.1 nucleotide exchange factor GrpE [Paenibacillus apis]